MGRGRAKAKQTKVARQLKYGGPRTDLSALEAELSGGPTDELHDQVEETEDDDVDDPYADDPYAKYYGDDDEDDDEAEDGRR